MTAGPGRKSAEANGPGPAERARWLHVMALAPWPLLDELSRFLLSAYRFEWLRRPEIGLVMAQGRVGGGGERFNLAEVPVTRCVVRSMFDTAGVGYVVGRSRRRAASIARMDAMLQVPSTRQVLWLDVIVPLEREIATRRSARDLAAASSRVRFYTLAPEAT